MVSRLATALLPLSHRKGEAADMLWRYATLPDVELTRTPISEMLTVEFAQFLDGSAAEHFARLLPDQDRITLAFTTNPSPAIGSGAVQNPRTADDVLHTIANGTLPKATKDRATERIALRDGLRTALSSADAEQILTAVAALVSDGDVAPFVALAHVDVDQLARLLAGTEDPGHRAMVIDSLPDQLADQLCSVLLGVFDKAGAAKVVDRRLAEWLCDADSTRADAARAELVSDKDRSNELLSRLAAEARRPLAEHDSLWSVVQRRTRSSSPVSAGPAKPLDMSMLQSIRMAGLGVAEISALIFSSKVELTPEELVEQLQGIDAVRLAAYFKGSNPRHPREGEIDALVASMDPFQQHELAEAIDGDIEHLSWYPELVVGIPRRFRSLEDPGTVQAIDRAMVDELSDDGRAWEVVLSMAEEWEGNLRSLMSAAQQL